ncbi:MAG: substrate-binding domain-containing protein, partial [Phyllobacterium sp.]
PTALIVASERVTVGVHHGFIERGLVPGRDIALIGRGGQHTRYLRPALTSFSLSLRDLGITLAESLLATMPAYAQDYPLGLVRKVVPFDFVEGDSDAMVVR